MRESITEHAPLSLLALAEGVKRCPGSQACPKGVFVADETVRQTKSVGEWRNNAYLRGILLKGLQRPISHDAGIPVWCRRGIGVFIKMAKRLSLYNGVPLPKTGSKITSPKESFSVSTSREFA